VPNRDVAKKKTLHATERDRPDVVEARKVFRKVQKTWDPSKLIFVDESGVNLSMTRAVAWAPIGERAVDAVPGGRWCNYSVIAALGLGGLRAPMVIPGAIDGAAMLQWVEHCLVPELKPGDIVIWDNLSVHGDIRLRSAIEHREATLIFLPPYSPDLNPIEQAWSKAKGILRELAPRRWKKLLSAIARALRAINPEDAAGWFQHAGYAVL
jgi:transposase